MAADSIARVSSGSIKAAKAGLQEIFRADRRSDIMPALQLDQIRITPARKTPAARKGFHKNHSGS
jgi:hypothetical protein